VAALDESRSLDAVAVAEGSASTDVRASTEVEASTEVGGSTEPRVIGAIAGGAIFVGAGVSGTLLAAIAASERLAAERSAISGGSGETTVRGDAESPVRAGDAAGGGAGGRFARVPGGFLSLGDSPPGLEGGLDSVA